MRYRRALLLLPAFAAASAIHAETLYVIEQLVVGVNSAPDASGERVANIKSGEVVEVLERRGDQIHVHLANGTEGWVKKSYLSAQAPLQQRLGEQTAEVAKLEQDVARLQGELAAAHAASRGKPNGAQANTGAGSPAAALSPAAPITTPTPTIAPNPAATQTHGTETAAENPSVPEPAYFMTPPQAPAHPVWHWALGSFAVALGLGFMLGWRMLDRRIRRKYGGLRIY